MGNIPVYSNPQVSLLEISELESGYPLPASNDVCSDRTGATMVDKRLQNIGKCRMTDLVRPYTVLIRLRAQVELELDAGGVPVGTAQVTQRDRKSVCGGQR